MRTLLIMYLAIAQVFAVALGVTSTPRHIAEGSTTNLVHQLMDSEKALWGALQRRDTIAWESPLADDYSHISADGVLRDRDGALEIFAHQVIERYALRDMRGELICPDVFVVSYSIERRWLDPGREFTGTFSSMAVWAMRYGTWQRVRYQETLQGAVATIASGNSP